MNPVIADGLRLKNKLLRWIKDFKREDRGNCQDNPVDDHAPLSYDDDAIMQRRTMMRTIRLSEDDASQVQAILMTHAEMQDHRTIESMTLLGRLKRDEPEAARDTITDLQGQIDDFEGDCDNLRRIAEVFN